MQQPEWEWTIERKLCSKAEAAALMIQEILDRMESLGWSQKEQLDTHLCLEEAFMNAIKHGNRNDSQRCVETKCWINTQHFRIQIQDEGSGFRIEEVPDCTKAENLTNCSGRGLMMMQYFMDVVQYNPVGNAVTMEKRRGNQQL
ncbi:MAG: ATP-binding protein [Pirellulaceae bacterium]|nr:ATP-binding protein [Pirellulaceae bacterium]